MNSPFLRALGPGLLLGTLAAPGAAPPLTLGRALLHLTADRPTFESVEDGRRAFPRIAGFGLTSRPGEPMLPLKVLLVAIPEGSVPELRISSARSESLNVQDLAPVPRLRVRDRPERTRAIPRGNEAHGDSPGEKGLLAHEEDFASDPRIFGRDQEFPDSPVRLGATGYLREQRFVEILFTPILYNPAGRASRYFPEVVAEVVFRVSEDACCTSWHAFRPDPVFEETYRQSFVNYEQGKLFRVESRGAVAAKSPSPVAAAQIPASSDALPRYKILVSRAGIYRLDYAYLQARAPDLLTYDPRTLALSAEGVPVPISIRSAAGGPGETDGRFDPDDFLEFLGRPKTTPPTVLNFDFGSTFPDVYQANDFTDTQVYWLSPSTAGAPPRIPELNGAPTVPGFPVAADFEESAVWDENNAYLPLQDADPFFSIPSLLAGSSQAQRDLSLALPGLTAAPATVRVTVRLRGGSDLSFAPDHWTQVRINGTLAAGADFTWDGEVIREQEFTVSQSVLTNPTAIQLTAPTQPGVSVDRQYLDTVTVRYRRDFNALGDASIFSYPNQNVRFQVSGLSSSVPTVYETTGRLAGSDEVNPVRIVGAAVSGSTVFTSTFDVAQDSSPSAPAIRNFIVAGPGALRLPDAFVRASDPTLRNALNEADLLVIAARDAADASPGGSLDALLNHRLVAQGLTSKVVFIDEIYDEFSYGLRDANAIRSFLNYVFDNWKGNSGTARPPSFVLLVGDATPDYKNTLNRADWVDQVPTPIMFEQSSILGYYSSDNWLASFRGGDQIPDVYLGRISTRSALASAAVFDKIRRYEESPPPGSWKGRAIVVAGDGKFSGEAAGFEAILEDLRTRYFSTAPFSVASPLLYFSEAPWNSSDASGFRSALINELNAGAAFLAYVGHGSFDVWGVNTFFTTTNAMALGNGAPMPFMVTINCLTGGFQYLLPGGSLGEGMMNNPAGGAIATLAPSGLSTDLIGQVVTDELFASLFGLTKERTLGVAASGLRSALWSRGSIMDLQSYTFLGDPATILATPAPPPPSGLAAAAGNGEVTLSWVPAPQPVTGYRFYRAESSPPGPYGVIPCDPATTTSCVDRTVVNGKTYYYYAASVDTEGYEGRASNLNNDCDSGPECVVARPFNPDPPSAPTGLTARDPGSGGRIDAAWQPNPERDIKEYSLYYGTQSTGYSNKLKLGATTASTTLTGLTDGIRYYFALSATNTSGHESSLSAEVIGVPHLIQGIAPPQAISDLTLTRSGSDLILAWSRPTVDIYGRPTTVVGYNIYRGASPGFQPFASAPYASLSGGSITTYADPGAAAPVGNFYYLVNALDGSGFMSGAGRELPNGISGLAISQVNATTLHLSWPAVTTDIQGLDTIIDHYQVHRTDRPVGRGSLNASTVVPGLDNVRALSVDLTVTPGASFFSVLAVDDKGNLSPL